jgi:myo-inositol-1(or 4)-monophosphatase
MQLSLSSEDLRQLCLVAEGAARRAGAMIADRAGTELTIGSKVGAETLAGQIVTEVDVRSQELIVEALRPSCARYGLALLAEESADDGERLNREAFWCVDPLDGTLSFVEQKPGYAVSIALVAHDGTPLIGVVFDPVKQVLYSTVRGQGALRDGQPWRTDSATTRAQTPLTFFVDRSFTKHPHYALLLQQLEEQAIALGCAGLRVVQGQGSVLNACGVAEQAPAVYCKFPKAGNSGGSLWDYAATACLLPETGALASDLAGQPLDLNRPDSTYLNHRGILYASNAQWAETVKKMAMSILRS